MRRFPVAGLVMRKTYHLVNSLDDLEHFIVADLTVAINVV